MTQKLFAFSSGPAQATKIDLNRLV